MRSSYVAARPASRGDDEGASRARSPRLLDRMRARMRRLGLSIRTEEVYVGWVRRFILANAKRHPRDMGAREVERFLTGLAVHGHVSASTQNQALSALLFLYREVLQQELPWMDGIHRAKRPKRLPVVLSREEVAALLGEMEGVTWLMASLLYGAGLRLMECMRLRIQDVDFVRHEITVRQGKGGKDRRTMLPAISAEALQNQMAEAPPCAQARSRRGLWCGVVAGCAGKEVSGCRARVGLAIRVSRLCPQHRSAFGHDGPAPYG